MSKLLFVCTANICRSPAAESMARDRYGLGGHTFSSAGFLYTGRSATPGMVKALAKIGVDASSHSSAIITAEGAQDADLILTMEARHVQDIAIMSPELFARTLPLGEAADQLAGRRITVEDLVAELAERNPLDYLDSKWDVDDPYKQSRRKHKKAVEQISGLVNIVVPALI